MARVTDAHLKKLKNEVANSKAAHKKAEANLKQYQKDKKKEDKKSKAGKAKPAKKAKKTSKKKGSAKKK